MNKTLWSIIPGIYRRRAVWVVATIFLRALLNFVGIATLVPLLIVILNRDAITSNDYLAEIYNKLNPSSYTNFIVIVCAIVVGIILIKNIVNLLLYRYERNYIYALYRELSGSMYRSYHDRGYSYIRQNNSAILTRNINAVSLMFVAGVLKPIASIICESALIAMMLGALTFYSPIAALLVVGVFLPVVSLFYLSMRRRLHNIGEEENSAQRNKNRTVAESLRGYVDIEISGSFPMMFNRFKEATDKVVELRKRNATLSQLPQMFVELGLTVGLCVLIIISLCISQDNVAVLFGIFAVAAIRFVPSTRNIMTSWSTIRYNLYSVETIQEALANYTESDLERTTERLQFNKSIELNNVTYRFEDADKPTISDLSISIARGECVGIRGASGVGKTTLFNLILGIYRPTRGSITIDGVTLCDENIAKWHNSIGYVSQHVFISEMSIAENIALGIELDKIDYNRLNKAIEMSDLKGFVDSLPNGINTQLGEHGSRLSGGQRQRIGIARALYKGCDILLLDEATSSLDSTSEENINNSIRRLSTDNDSLTIVIIAHRDSSLEYCNRIITLE